MAKLKPISFSAKSPTGETMSFKAETTVGQNGTFRLTLPAELHGASSALVATSPYKGAIEVASTEGGVQVAGDTLDLCIRFVNAAMVNHLACEVTREKVILYGTNIRVAYVKDERGDFHPNGSYAPRIPGEIGESRWRGTLNGSVCNDRHYSIGLVARVWIKVTYRCPSSTKVVYERANDAKHGTYHDRLNGFVGLRYDTNGFSEMPYTEEAAKFFYDTLIGLCALADRMTEFFGDADAIQKAIQQQGSILSLPAPASTPST